MLTTPAYPPELQVTQVLKQRQKPLQNWHKLALAALLLVAAFFNFFGLTQENTPNAYYASGVRSMVDNWRNFFFVSFDPGGFVSIDKPALGFWIQAASAKLLGFSTFSILLPEALAGLLSVALLFHLVRRFYGPVAGLLAGLALAITPITIITDHNNTIDSLLAFTVLCAAWAIMHACEKGHLRWLLLCAAIVGLGFNIKMAEAYLVVPAFGLTYLLGAPRRWRIKLPQLLLALVLLLAISLSWSMSVDLTPANQRPYVGSTQDNSEISLAFGYNGIKRFRIPFLQPAQTNTTGKPSNGQIQPAPTRKITAIPGGFFSSETGNPGILRFFNQEIAGQISWLLPIALLGMLALAWQERLRLPLTRKQQGLVLWGIWMLTMLAFFSEDQSFHLYYLVMLSPAIAALAGIGVVTLWQDYARPGSRGWLLPITLVITGSIQAGILSTFPNWGNVLTPFVLGISLLAALILILARLRTRIQLPHMLITATTIGVLALFIAPTVWAAIPLGRLTTNPAAIAGPFHDRNPGTQNRTVTQTQMQDPILQYLQANTGKESFLVATLNSGVASPIILATNQPVMTLGGFSGNDPILTSDQLSSLVQNGTVRFFLFSAPVRQRFSGPNGLLLTWVSSHCAPVARSQWQSLGTRSRYSSLRFYDCRRLQP